MIDLPFLHVPDLIRDLIDIFDSEVPDQARDGGRAI